MIAQFYSVESLIFVECMTSGFTPKKKPLWRDGTERTDTRIGGGHNSDYH